MSEDLENRIKDLEAQLRALRSLVLSDIASTQDDGTRDPHVMISIASGEMAAAVHSTTPKAAVCIDDLLEAVRAVLDIPPPPAGG